MGELLTIVMYGFIDAVIGRHGDIMLLERFLAAIKALPINLLIDW